MIYVALLRGINVGGKNKLNMKELKQIFEKHGMKSVSTYINSGNIIFENNELKKSELVKVLEKAIFNEYALNIDILIRSKTEYTVMMNTLPEYWTNDKSMKTDVLFLSEEIDSESILNKLTIKPEIDTVLYVPGALFWSVDREKVTKSGMMKLAGSTLYKKMTLRNVNTTRQVFKIMEQK